MRRPFWLLPLAVLSVWAHDGPASAQQASDLAAKYRQQVEAVAAAPAREGENATAPGQADEASRSPSERYASGSEEYARLVQGGETGYDRYLRLKEYIRAMAVVLIIATAIIAQFLTLRCLHTVALCTPSHVFNATGLIYIIFGTILIVTIADNKDQLTASIGILGAIAGYLFGRMSRGEAATAKEPPAAP